MKVFIQVSKMEVIKGKAAGKEFKISIRKDGNKYGKDDYASEKVKKLNFEPFQLDFSTKNEDKFRMTILLIKKHFLRRNVVFASSDILLLEKEIPVTSQKSNINFDGQSPYSIDVFSAKNDRVAKFSFKIFRYKSANSKLSSMSVPNLAEIGIKDNHSPDQNSGSPNAAKYRSKELIGNMLSSPSSDGSDRKQMLKQPSFSPVKNNTMNSDSIADSIKQRTANTDPLVLKLAQAKQLNAVNELTLSDDEEDNFCSETKFRGVCCKFLDKELRYPSNSDLGSLPNGFEQAFDTESDREYFIDTNHANKKHYIDPRLWEYYRKRNCIDSSHDPIKQKINDYYEKMKFPCQGSFHDTNEITIDRRHIYRDSYQLLNIPPQDLRRVPLQITFKKESGVDLGGLKRDLVTQVSQTMMIAEYGMFTSATGKLDGDATINQFVIEMLGDDFRDLKLMGVIISLCILYKLRLSGRLSVNFVKALFYEKYIFTVDDLKEEDMDAYNHIQTIMNEDVDELDLTFSVTYKNIANELVETNLINGGNAIPVKNANKGLYVKAYLRWHMLKRIQKPVVVLRDMIKSIIGPLEPLCETFTPSELVRFLCGEKTVDVKDWYNHTRYLGDIDQNSECVVNFWKFLLMLDNIQMSAVLYFTLGIFRSPTGGFSNLELADNTKTKFTIRGAKNQKFLMASTCFNLLDLPLQNDFAKMIELCVFSIENCRGFGGVD